MKRKHGSILLFLLLAAVMLAGCSAQSEKAGDANGNAAVSTLTFSAAELTQEPTFVDWTQDGTAMQLIARKDENGAVRLAFNPASLVAARPTHGLNTWAATPCNARTAA